MSLARTTTTTRRQWLKAALALGAASATSGLVALVRTGGYEVAPDVVDALAVLSPGQYVVADALAARIVAPDRPEDPSIPSAREVGVARFMDGYLAEMGPSMRRDLLRMLHFVEHVAPLSSGFARRFTALSADDQDEVLRGIASSRIEVLRAGFEGLKSLVMMGYYRDPRTWPILEYDGPWLGRSSSN